MEINPNEIVSNKFLRDDTAKQYKEVRKILHSNIPLKDHDDMCSDIWEMRSRGKFLEYVVFGLLILGGIVAACVLFSGCASAESINMSVIAQIESGGHPDAFNRHSGAVGMYQITPICLKDYNKYHNKVEMRDMYKGAVAHIVADWYFNHRIPSLLQSVGIKDTINNRIWAYNAGIGMVKKGIKPLETRNYIKKYHRLNKEV